MKVIFAQKLLETWRAEHKDATIQMHQPEKGDGKGSQPGKITVQGKAKADTEEVLVKVEDFLKSTGAEVLKADAGVVNKLFESANSSWLAKRFREIRDTRSNVTFRRHPEGLSLVGKKSELTKAKGELKDCLEKANFEPTKVPVDNTKDQLRVFTKETMDKIRDSCDLMEMYKDSKEEVLVLLGDSKAVAKANKQIQEVIDKEAAVDSLEISEHVWKELRANRGAKIQELQSKHGTSISVDKKTYDVKIFGSVEGVEATKKEIEDFAKKADRLTTKTMSLQDDQIGRVIGSKGSTLHKIREESGAQVTLDKTSLTLEMRGEKNEVEQAEQMINEILGNEAPKPKAKAKADAKPAAAEKAQAPAPKAAAPKKAAEGYKGDATEDFPTLGGVAEPKKKPAAKAWGKKSEAEASPPAKEETPEQAYPSLPGTAKAAPEANEERSPAEEQAEEDPAEEAAAPEERSVEEDYPSLGSAPKAKARGKPPSEEKSVDEAYPALGGGKPKASPAPKAAVEEEEAEEAGGDMCDPFEMMGGMGEEEVYKVTLMEEKAAEDA